MPGGVGHGRTGITGESIRTSIGNWHRADFFNAPSVWQKNKIKSYWYAFVQDKLHSTLCAVFWKKKSFFLSDVKVSPLQGVRLHQLNEGANSTTVRIRMGHSKQSWRRGFCYGWEWEQEGNRWWKLRVDVHVTRVPYAAGELVKSQHLHPSCSLIYRPSGSSFF